MGNYRQRLGRQGEEIAAHHLEQLGYDILMRNWRCPAGEVDIVAQYEQTLVLVEVRLRTTSRYGIPEESITETKRAGLIACGQHLVAELKWAGPWRIDVVAIEMGKEGMPHRICVIPNAVEG